MTSLVKNNDAWLPAAIKAERNLPEATWDKK
jgi:hypothetical protein